MLREVADFDTKDFENPDDTKGVYPRFYVVPKQDEAKSVEAGRPIFTDREYVEIFCVGNENNIVRRPVTDIDRRRFRSAYALFKAGDTEQLVGTPLTEIPWLTRSQVEEFAYLKIKTVEALAELNDAVCTNNPGTFELKRKAGAWLQKAKEAAPFTALHKENEDLRKRLAALEAAASTPAPKSK